MDGDDVAYPARLERQLRFLEQNPGVDLVGSAMLVFCDDGRPIGKRSAPPGHLAIAEWGLGSYRLYHPTWLGRTSWFRAHEYQELPGCEDQFLLLRAEATSTFANIGEPLLGYREERVDLQKALASRVRYVGGGTSFLLAQRRPVRALLLTLSQVAKAIVDVLGVTTGFVHGTSPQRLW